MYLKSKFRGSYLTNQLTFFKISASLIGVPWLASWFQSFIAAYRKYKPLDAISSGQISWAPGNQMKALALICHILAVVGTFLKTVE